MHRLLTMFLLAASLVAQAEAEPKIDLRPLLQRVSEEIDWQPDFATAAAKAKETQRPLLVVVNRFRGFAIPDPMRLHVFADPDVSKFVRERFVCMRYAPEQDAPFRDYAVYGMGPNTLGAALLVVSPEGEVLHETHTTNPFAAYDFLSGLVPRERIDGTDVFAEADRFRVVRSGKQALRSLARARILEPKKPLPNGESSFDVFELIVHLRMGEAKQAHECAKRLAERHSKGMPPEVAHWVAVSALVSGDTKNARKVLGLMVEHVPDSEWTARLAVAFARVHAEELYGKLDLRWPAEETIRSLRNVKPARPSEDLAAIEREAVDFLLAAQRDDGSWISPSEISVRVRHHPFTIAITALAGRATLQRRDDARCLAATERAIEFVLAKQELLEAEPLPTTFMDYSVWSDAMALWFFSECLQHEVGDADALRKGGKLAARRLQQKQRASGGFSYFLTTDPSNASAPPPEAMSFTTAAAANAMMLARQAGIVVDGDKLEQAIDAVERARGENGAFAYSVGKGKGGAKPDGAAGRGPLCELTLHRARRAELTDVRRALGIFFAHRKSFERELGKSLMHAGPDGQGCHYLFFDYATAAEAVALLPEDERGEHRDWLLETILRARSAEGGFRDTSINGWPFGTAMALIAMHALR